MTDPDRSVGADIPQLYELSLAVGRSLDLHEACRHFLELLMARRNLSYAAVWMESRALDPQGPAGQELVWAIPSGRTLARRLPPEHAQCAWLHARGPGVLADDSAEFRALCAEADVRQGAYAVFPLHDVGLLKLYSRDPAAFPARALNQLRAVVDKFSIAVRGALTHRLLQAEVRERELAQARIQDMAESFAHVRGEAFFQLLVEKLARWTRSDYALITELTDPPARRVRTLAFWNRGRLGDNFAYDLRHTPCDAVLDGAPRAYPHDLQARFPQDRDLVEMGANCYLGVPVSLPDGTTHGHIAVMDRQPMPPERVAEQQSILSLTAGRAATELERLHIEADLARRVEVRTAELSAANRRLAEAMQAKDDFLAMMSHELRTPLTAILGMGELLAAQVRGPLTAAQQHYVGTIRASGQHLLSLINDLLDVAKLGAGKLQLEPEAFPVRRLVDASLELIGSTAREKGIRITTTLDMDLETLHGDERRLRQVLVNLLSNAVKFTPEGGSVGLEAAWDRAAARATLSVWDTGSGIAEADLGRLFQPFSQLDQGLARRHAGTGLGLALVARLVELHGGTVTVDSSPGQGSRFTVALPSASAAAVSAAPPDPQDSPAVRPHPATAATVLLAEDNLQTRQFLGDYLATQGFRVLTAEDGEEALRLAARQRPDLVLMDIQMPRLDGLAAIRRMRADPQLAALPIIALTALAMPGDRERCLEAGADGYLAKPVTLEQLQQTIADRLRKEGI